MFFNQPFFVGYIYSQKNYIKKFNIRIKFFLRFSIIKLQPKVKKDVFDFYTWFKYVTKHLERSFLNFIFKFSL